MSKLKIENKLKGLKGIDLKTNNRTVFETIIEKLDIKRLEYCRALHAEENALLQASRRGGMGVQGGTIYTTTFPCELCAKKIRQAGIKKIVYTEPYPDTISESVFLKEGGQLPEIKQFEGVKFTAYSRLFKPKFNKKERQQLENSNCKDQLPS